MKNIGFLGCGKIGQAMLRHIERGNAARIAFVQDPFYPGDAAFPVIEGPDEGLYAGADLVVECATAEALVRAAPMILKHCDLMVFSGTAFSDEAFAEEVRALCARCGRRVYLPHGAILGLDGIRDARGILTEVRIVTVKSPKTLGRSDGARTVVFDGSTREACRLYPRNVNVHAGVALAGLGFDRTRSVIVSDPEVSTNAHTIFVEGEGISFQLSIRSLATGGVTGAYTPLSACGSLDRVLLEDGSMRFV